MVLCCSFDPRSEQTRKLVKEQENCSQGKASLFICRIVSAEMVVCSRECQTAKWSWFAFINININPSSIKNVHHYKQCSQISESVLFFSWFPGFFCCPSVKWHLLINMSMEHPWNDVFRGKLKYWEGNMPQFNFFHLRSHMD